MCKIQAPLPPVKMEIKIKLKLHMSYTTRETTMAIETHNDIRNGLREIMLTKKKKNLTKSILVVLELDLIFGNYIRIGIKISVGNRVELLLSISIEIGFIVFMCLFKGLMSDYSC